MNKSVHYIGLDVYKETIAVTIPKETDILATLARRSRKVRVDLFPGDPG